MENDQPKPRRGRQKGSGNPKPPKEEAKPAHRPSPWSSPTEVDVKIRVPQYVADAWRDFDFKKQVDKLALDYAARQ